MNNYEHEISCPDNKGILNYLWIDHFHDGKIDNISFDHRKGLVVLTLDCCREREDIWKKLKYSDDLFKVYLNENIDSFTYILTFKGTEYFLCERLIMVNDYINGRFKDTALLSKLSAETKKPLYHFRIQTDDGYMDIIFSNFVIKKKTGRVKYAIKETTARTHEWIDEDSKKAALDGDDFERFLAMQKLFMTNDPALPEIARKNLWFEDNGDSCLYSAYLLGKLGGVNDISKLFELYLKIEEHLVSKSVCRYGAILPKRNILNAIELIHHKLGMLS